MTPPRPSLVSHTMTALQAVRANPAQSLGIKVERVAVALCLCAADVAGSVYFKPPWWAAAGLFVLAMLVAAPGVVSTAIQTMMGVLKDAKASWTGTP